MLVATQNRNQASQTRDEAPEEIRMQQGLDTGWRRGRVHRGAFNGYAVQAFKYVSPTGAVGWQTTSWPMKDPVHLFWVSGGEFYEADVRVARTWGRIYQIDINERLDVDLAERKAVLEAIEAWGNADRHAA
jgi:hypothetical protein